MQISIPDTLSRDPVQEIGGIGMETTIQQTPEREAFYERIGTQNLTALWQVLGALITPEPRSGCRPAMWRYADVRAPLLEAGAFITAREAERRVLILENPGLRGQSRIPTSLYAGVQPVMRSEERRVGKECVVRGDLGGRLNLKK